MNFDFDAKQVVALTNETIGRLTANKRMSKHKACETMAMRLGYHSSYVKKIANGSSPPTESFANVLWLIYSTHPKPDLRPNAIRMTNDHDQRAWFLEAYPTIERREKLLRWVQWLEETRGKLDLE